jgi:hypothetical protein
LSSWIVRFVSNIRHLEQYCIAKSVLITPTCTVLLKQHILAFPTVCQQLSLAYQSAERFQWTFEQRALIRHSPNPPWTQKHNLKIRVLISFKMQPQMFCIGVAITILRYPNLFGHVLVYQCSQCDLKICVTWTEFSKIVSVSCFNSVSEGWHLSEQFRIFYKFNYFLIIWMFRQLPVIQSSFLSSWTSDVHLQVTPNSSFRQ